MFNTNQYAMTNNMILDMTSDFAQKSRQEEGARLVQKWKKTKLLEGLSSDKQENLAFILENEAKHLRGKILQETTSVGDIAGFNKIAFPLVRRVFAQLLTNNIVSVQPMSQASGLVFFLDYTFDSGRAGQTRGGSIYGNRTTPLNGKSGGIGTQTGDGGFYGFQGLGYAHSIYNIAPGPGSQSSPIETATSYAVTGTLSGFDYTVSGGLDYLAAKEFRLTKTSSLVNDAGSTSAFRTFTRIASHDNSLTANIDYELTKFTSTTTIRFFSNVDLVNTATLSGTQLTVVGRVETLLNDSSNTSGVQTLLGDFENTSAIPAINLKVLQTFVSAQTKKLKTVWTPEVAQDLNAYISIDAEVELTNVLSEQIAVEIDREILNDLLTIAAVKGAWSRKIGHYVYVNSQGVITDSSSASVTFSNQAFYADQDTWNQTLGHVVSAVSNRIYKLNLRKGANWMVCGMQVASILETLGKGFKVEDSANTEELQYSAGIEKIGTLNTKYTVYKDPYFPEDVILMGYKGNSPMETGYVFAPYIPLIVSPTIIDPNSFIPNKMVMTRNGKTAIRPDFYGTIKVIDLNFYTF